MRRALLSLLIGAAILAGIPAQAFWNSRDSNYNISIASGSSYVGPGDVISGATVWYGLRGYSAAYAAPGTGKSVNVRRASDNATQDIVILTTGALDVASYNTFVGTDATCTGSMVGTTTLTISGCASGTIHANDPISGAGIVEPAYVTAIGTCGAGAGTCTLNAAQTFASETVTAQVAGFATKLYDETVGNACAGSASCDAIQATAGNQPLFLPSCVNSMPCLVSNTAGSNLTSANTFTPNAAHQLTLSMVLQQGASTTGNFFFQMNGSNNYIKHQSGVANKWQLGVGGSNVALSTANDGVWHAANAVEVAGTNASILNIDGVEVTATATPNSTAAAPVVASGANGSFVYSTEFGFWDNLVFSGANRTAVCKNQQAYYNSGSFGAVC